jgi:hypothetical protein
LLLLLLEAFYQSVTGAAFEFLPGKSAKVQDLRNFLLPTELLYSFLASEVNWSLALFVCFPDVTSFQQNTKNFIHLNFKRTTDDRVYHKCFVEYGVPKFTANVGIHPHVVNENFDSFQV